MYEVIIQAFPFNIWISYCRCRIHLLALAPLRSSIRAQTIHSVK